MFLLSGIDMKYYSKSKKALFDTRIFRGEIPEDSVQVSKSDAENILQEINSVTASMPDKNGLCMMVDNRAGEVASSFAPYSLADQEYKLTQAQVAEWRSSGSPAGDIPSALQSWVDASGLSAEDAATSIEASAESLNSALLEIRRIRLKAKRDIIDAETIEVAVSIRDTALAELEALK